MGGCDLTPSGYVCNVRDVTEAETTEAAPPIMVRAEITADEWRQFRTLAVSTGVRVQQLVGEAIDRFGVRDARIVHRLGRLEIGETSVFIAVASAHRAAAMDACRWLIDTLKKTVPIWKKEYFEDGAVWADGEPFPDNLRPVISEKAQR